MIPLLIVMALASQVASSNIHSVPPVGGPVAGVRLWSSVAQTVPTAGSHDAEFDTVIRTSPGMLDPNPAGGIHTRVYAPVSGWYAIALRVRWAASAAGERQLNIYRLPQGDVGSGITLALYVVPGTATASQTYQSLFTMGYLNAGDAIRCTLRQTTGGDLDTVVSTSVNIDVTSLAVVFFGE